jgi:hypothetical protein
MAISRQLVIILLGITTEAINANEQESCKDLPNPGNGEALLQVRAARWTSLDQEPTAIAEARTGYSLEQKHTVATTEQRRAIIGDLMYKRVNNASRKRWLVFTSVGDKGVAENWTRGGVNPQFDVFASYYGDDEKKLEVLRSVFTRVWPSKGAKFPNFYHFRESAEGQRLLKEYSSIIICDDDIDLHPLKAHVLFQVREDLNLSILIPAFHPRGRISWGSSVYVANSFLRFGTFMEMTCPVFDTQVLERYMTEIYSPTVVGWGVDLLYMWYLDKIDPTRDPRKTAVLDVAVITNPIGRNDGKREIDTYFPQREQTWNNFLKERHLDKERFLHRGTPLIRKSH